MTPKPMPTPDTTYQYIDPTILFNLAADDIDLFRMLAATYRDMTPAILWRLQNALLAVDRESISHECHSLRGATSLIGAAALTDMLLSIERHCRSDPPAPLPPYGTPLATLFDMTLQEVEFSITHFRRSTTSPSGKC